MPQNDAKGKCRLPRLSLAGQGLSYPRCASKIEFESWYAAATARRGLPSLSSGFCTDCLPAFALQRQAAGRCDQPSIRFRLLWEPSPDNKLDKNGDRVKVAAGFEGVTPGARRYVPPVKAP
jgi:hypothetical protein